MKYTMLRFSEHGDDRGILIAVEGEKDIRSLLSEYIICIIQNRK